MFQRPHYETIEDSFRETAVLEEVARKLGVKIDPAGAFSFLDAVVRDVVSNKKLCYLEVKTRHITHGTYHDYRVSRRKWDEAQERIKDELLLTYLILDLEDGLFYAPLNRQYEFGVIARTDRGDPCDEEEAICIPWSNIKRLV